MNSPLPKLVFLTDSSDALLLGAGSDSSDAIPWVWARTPVTLLLGRGLGLQ
ncbi:MULTISPECIES: hypothetical protein [Paenibacillus]|uniref:hypothetical protein n=1 Tax=Paenibacillus TaxID=44249 RepID=UPI0015C3C2D7|nr:hypothetical protein [Paenibacillus odorifer]